MKPAKKNNGGFAPPPLSFDRPAGYSEDADLSQKIDKKNYEAGAEKYPRASSRC